MLLLLKSLLSARPHGLVMLVWATLAAPSFAAVYDYPDLHRMTTDELAELEKASTDSLFNTRISLAFAVATGRTRFDEGIAMLESMPVDILAGSERVYRLAGLCGLRVRTGDIGGAEIACEELAEHLDAGSAISPSAVALAYDARGSLAMRQGRTDEALAHFDRGLEAAVVANDKVMQVLMHHNRSVPLAYAGMTDLAVRCLERASARIEVMPADSAFPSILHFNLGYILAQRGDHKGALKHYQDVLPWTHELGHSARAYLVKTQIAASLTALGKPQAALDTIEPLASADLPYPLPDDYRSDSYLVVGNAYLALDQVATALAWFQRGKLVADNAGNPLRKKQLALALVDVRLRTEEPRIAIAELEELLEQADTSKYEADVLGRLAQAHARIGEHEIAWKHQVRLQEAIQRDNSDAFNARLSALRATNEIDKVELELSHAQSNEHAAELRAMQDRAALYLTIATAILIVVIGLAWYRRNLDKREAIAHSIAERRLEKIVADRTQELQGEMAARIAAEREKSSLEKRVAEDERLRAVGQLTGGVAHDFNNLLTVILLSADLLKSGRAGDAAALLEDILKAGESGKAITRSLLAYARQQDLQPEIVELSAFLHRHSSLFKRTLGDSIDLALDTRPAHILVDRGQLTTCILNLLFNASEALGTQGNVRIEVDTTDPAYVQLLIIDDGPGMPDEVLSRATDPFFTTKTDGKGSGLGLSMVYGFTKQSGGDLVIERIGDGTDAGDGRTRGTRVTLKFPNPPPQVMPDIVLAPAQSNSIGEARRALLVDDQAAVRLVCCEALTGMGFEVVQCEDGHAALAELEKDVAFDIVVSDAVMPGGILGTDLAEKLAVKDPDLPILLISGGPISIPSNCAFLAKPFKLAEFRGAVQQLLDPPTPSVAV